jgi:hypothetical protein
MSDFENCSVPSPKNEHCSFFPKDFLEPISIFPSFEFCPKTKFPTKNIKNIFKKLLHFIVFQLQVVDLHNG